MSKTIVFFTARDLSNVGGGERMLSFVANKLCDDFKIIILTPYDSNCYYKLNGKVTLQSLGLKYQNNGIKRKIQYVSILKRLRQWMKSNLYDYFITSSSMAFLLTSIICWKKDYRLYAWMHLSYYHPTHKLLKWLEKKSYRKFNIISINSLDIDVYRNFSSFVTQIPNPRPFKSIEKADLDTKRIISVGRLEKGKRFDLLVDICTNVFNKIPDWTLDIYGQDEGEKSTIERKISENGMTSRIKIHNPISNIKDEYLKSSIFVTTTKIEAFPLMLIEACECGLPSISFDVPSGPRDIIENDYNGYLLKEGDSDNFENKLASLMLSEKLRKTMGNNAIEKANFFDETTIIEKWYKLFGYDR